MDINVLYTTYGALALTMVTGMVAFFRKWVQRGMEIEALKQGQSDLRQTIHDVCEGVDRKLDSIAETNALVRELRVALVGLDGENGMKSEIRALKLDVVDLKERMK